MDMTAFHGIRGIGPFLLHPFEIGQPRTIDKLIENPSRNQRTFRVFVDMQGQGKLERLRLRFFVVLHEMVWNRSDHFGRHRWQAPFISGYMGFYRQLPIF